MAPQLLSRERNLILVSLIVLAVAAWGIVAWRADTMDTGSRSLAMNMPGDSAMTSSAPTSEVISGSPTAMQPNSSMTNASTDDMASVNAPSLETAASGGMRMGLTMNMSATLFLGVWVAMMVAMMFPTAAPMILAFAKIQSTRQNRGQVFVPTWLFVLAYIALWSSTGLLAFAIASFADNLAQNSHWLAANAARIGGAVLVVAGVYQLSPWKNRCLAQCRTPTGFIMTRWKDGRRGALRMGLEHGSYCLGCCWLLFVILFPLGIMNVAAMAFITVLIFAEKSLVIGERIARYAAFGLMIYGALVLIALPGALPTSMTI